MRPRYTLVSTLLFIGILVLPATMAHAQDKPTTVIRPEQLKWATPAGSLPTGSETIVLVGNPAQEGPFVLRLKLPAGTVIRPHRHSTDEIVTVMSGELGVGVGDTPDPAGIMRLPPGSFMHLPAGTPHYARIEVETVLQINGIGPLDRIFVTPKDDPRGK
jgi:quercetin dioxygenase-like cupin family protein